MNAASVLQGAARGALALLLGAAGAITTVFTGVVMTVLIITSQGVRIAQARAERRGLRA